jgi:hypothetical protein
MKKKETKKRRIGFDLLIFLFVLALFILKISDIVLLEKEEEEKIKPIVTEINYWKTIALENKTYPDAWVKLAISWHKIGRDDLSKLAIAKARRLDPLRSDIENIEHELSLKYNKKLSN